MNGLLRSDGELLKTAKSELDKMPSGKVALKLKAIIAVSEHPAKTVAGIFGCSVGTLRNWVNRFASGGIGGLIDKKRKPRRSKLDRAQTDETLQLLDSHSQRWTLKILRGEIRKRFGIDISLNGIWKMLKREGYSHLSPRPVHYKQDKRDIGEFKKNFPN